MNQFPSKLLRLNRGFLNFNRALRLNPSISSGNKINISSFTCSPRWISYSSNPSFTKGIAKRQFSSSFFERSPVQGFKTQPNPSSSTPSVTSVIGGSLSFALFGTALSFAGAAFIFQDYLEKKESFIDDVTNISSPLQSLIQSVLNIGNYQIGATVEPESSWEVLKEEVSSRFRLIRENWEELKRFDKAIWGLIGLNGLVFILWQIPRLGPFMSKHFLHHPTSTRYYTLVTSTFSHSSLWHFGLNMMALKSFGHGAGYLLGAEQFIGFYLSAGILASLGRRVISPLLPKNYGLSSLIPSLGASGAILGVVGTVAYYNPNAKSHIIFLPGIQFDLSQLVAGMMALDFLGIVRGWKTFDHFAHLTGVLFGLAYGAWGNEYIWFPINDVVFKFKTFLKKLE